MNKNIMKTAGFEKEVKRFEQGKCVFCNIPICLEDFIFYEISGKEYEISGMCQQCQDEIFGED